jgi:hypothetical protein
MPAPVLRWYEVDGTTPAGTDTYTPIAGTPTAAQTTRLYNDNGGTASADTATEVRLVKLARNVGETEFLASHPLAIGGFIETRTTGYGGTGIPAQTTGWVGGDLLLRDMPSDTYRVIETRINAPAGYGTEEVEVLIRAVAASPAVAISEGSHEAGAVGISHGVGDGAFSELLEGGTVVEEGTPGDTVEHDLVTWIHKGIPYTLVPGAVTIPDTDANSDTLASGESVIVALTLGAGSVTQTPGILGTSPTAPTPPDGEPLLGYVTRLFSGVITNSEIDQTERRYGWFKAETSGASLVVTLSGGQAMTGNALIRLTGTSSVTLTASDDNYVWLRETGTFSATLTEERPTERALLLYKFTTDGSGVTATVDRRNLIGRRLIVMSFEKAAWTGSIYSAWPSGSLGYILPLRGILLTLGVAGTVSGNTIADINQAPGTSFTTIFTSQGSSDQRPTLPFGAANVSDSGARPEVYRIEPWSRWRVDADATAGTPGTDASVFVIGVEVDA